MKRRFLAQSTTRRPILRQGSALVAAVALASVTAGCQVNSPVQTDVEYVPADGVPVDVGQLAIRNLALVGNGGGPVILTGSAINTGQQPMTIRFVPQAAEGATEAPTASEVQLRPREQVDLASKNLQLRGVTAKPGGIVTVAVTSDTGGSAVTKVPLLPPRGYYATVTVAPTGA